MKSPVLAVSPRLSQVLDPAHWQAISDSTSEAAVLLLVPNAESAGLCERIRAMSARPVGIAGNGQALRRGELYVQATASEPRLPVELLRASAETLNACATLAEAMAVLTGLLGERLGWRSLGIRVAPAAAQTLGTGLAAATLSPPHAMALRMRLPVAYYEGRPLVSLALPVLARDEVVALQLFAVPAAAPEELLALAAALAGQLAALARRAGGLGSGRPGRRRSEAASVAAMEEVARTFNHELSQPLAAALNYAGALTRTAADERERRIAQRLMSQLMRARARLHELGAQLLADAPPEPVDLARLLNARMPRMVPQVGRLSVDLAPTLPTVHIHRPYLEQVLDNLLDVACALTADGGIPGGLQLQAACDGSAVRLSMRSDRIDLREMLGRWLGAPLYRALEDGLGLRLAVSRALLEALGGGLRLEDGEEGDARLVLSLPLSATAGAPRAEQTSAVGTYPPAP